MEETWRKSCIAYLIEWSYNLNSILPPEIFMVSLNFY